MRPSGSACSCMKFSSHAVGIFVSRLHCSTRHESAPPTPPSATFCLMRASRKCLFPFALRFISVSTTTAPAGRCRRRAGTRLRAASRFWASGYTGTGLLRGRVAVGRRRRRVGTGECGCGDGKRLHAGVSRVREEHQSLASRHLGARTDAAAARKQFSPSTRSCRRRTRLSIANWKPLASRRKRTRITDINN